MRRIGIMSMQRILNYGSSLQAYALRRMIENADDTASVMFVDYRRGAPLVDGVSQRSTARITRTIVKAREYNRIDATRADRLRFVNHKRTYARKYFPLIGLPLSSNLDLDLDVQVIGSDEVFNCVQSNANVGYSRDLFGHHSPARKVVSYAGSFGNTTLEKIEQFGIRRDLEQDFARFEAISVRDANSAAIVEALTGARPEIHVDPVLAFDFSADAARLPADRLVDDPYLIVYGYAGRLTPDENARLRAYARSRRLKILCLGGPQACGDAFVDCDPFALLAYFRDAEAVVTDTFHGTIFAIINRRPFATITRASVGHRYGNQEKLRHLLATLGLEARELTELGAVTELLSEPVDYSSVQARLGQERSRSHAYLRATILDEHQS